MRRLIFSLLLLSFLPFPALAGSTKPPKILIASEGPVGEAVAQTLVSRLTELGYPAKIGSFSWSADLKLQVRTNLKERVAKLAAQGSAAQEEIIVTETSIDIQAEDKNGFIVLQQHLNHPFAIRIEEGLDEAARNLMKNNLPDFEKKLDQALNNLRQS